jgi:hypothetical protein
VRSTRAFLIGAGAAHLFDPRRGRRLRRTVRDRSAAFARRGARLGSRKARFAGGHVRGLVAAVRRLSAKPDVATDDATVTQRIRSDALQDAGVSTRDVEVEFDAGVATLQGSVDSRTVADDLVSRVAKVPGVQDVAAMIRVTNGEPGF